MNQKNKLDSFMEKLVPGFLKQYANQIVVNFIFILGLILLGWVFGNSFLLRLGFVSLGIYALVMIVVVIRVGNKGS